MPKEGVRDGTMEYVQRVGVLYVVWSCICYSNVAIWMLCLPDTLSEDVFIAITFVHMILRSRKIKLSNSKSVRFVFPSEF